MDCFVVQLSCPNNDMAVGVRATRAEAEALAKVAFTDLEAFLAAANDLYGWDAARAITIDIVTFAGGEPVSIETEYDLDPDPDDEDDSEVDYGGEARTWADSTH